MQDIRLSVSEAAKLFGLSQQTIRRALKAGSLQYIIVRGRYRISFLSTLKWSQTTTASQNKLKNKGLGQFVDQWKIKNKLISPHPDSLRNYT
jgi:excisionase family DNA binding protein